MAADIFPHRPMLNKNRILSKLGPLAKPAKRAARVLRKFHRGVRKTIWPPGYWTADIIGDDGERVTHLYPNDCYYAHLSVYRFALPFCKDRMVLDAGSGAGYGTAFLAKNGARFVEGIDVEAKAVEFSKAIFKMPNLKYAAMDLQYISNFPPHFFDVIFTSNTLEHVSNVYDFIGSVCRLLKPDGVLILAVPPIINEMARLDSMGNPYHLNIWSPRQWFFTVSLFFREIQCYRHEFCKPGVSLNFGNSPEETAITENDFIFTPVSVDDYYVSPNMLSVLMAVRQARAMDELPSLDEPIVFIDNSFTRPRKRE